MLKKGLKKRSGFLIGLMIGIGVVLIVGGVMIVIFNHHDEQDEVNLPTTTQPTESASGSEHLSTFEISPADHIYGEFDAPVTMVVFSDLQCAYSAEFHQTYLWLASESEYQNKLRIVWRHFPFDSIHPQARPAAVAAECAAKQNKFWEFIQIELANQDQLNSDFYLQIASQLELDMDQFTPCLQEQLTRDIIEAHYQEGLAKGARVTPASFVNGRMFQGAVSYSELKTIIDNL